MKITKGLIVDGRPQLNNTLKPPKGSLMGKSRLFKTLAPSANPSHFIYRIKKILEKILHFFIIEKPDPLHGRLAAVLTNSTLPREISMGNLIAHYKRFLGDNRAPPELLKCFEQLNDDETKLQNFQAERSRAERNRDGSKKTSVEAKKEQFLAATVNNITSMKNGATRLMLLHRTRSNNDSHDGDLFCLIHKNQDKYTLRFLGSNTAMSVLQKETVPLAGKEKVMRELVFENISTTELCANDWLKGLVKQWGEWDGVSPELLLNQPNIPDTPQDPKPLLPLLEVKRKKMNLKDWGFLLQIEKKCSL